MPNIRVVFDRIDVAQDADPGATDAKGDFYWALDVNGDRVSERLVEDPLQVGNGGTINLGQGTSVELQSGEELIVTGYLAEKDSGFAGADEREEFRHTWDESEDWGDGLHEVDFNDPDHRMACTLHYTIVA
jgi:hypothetical protein